jgi:hypothetical protein
VDLDADAKQARNTGPGDAVARGSQRDRTGPGASNQTDGESARTRLAAHSMGKPIAQTEHKPSIGKDYLRCTSLFLLLLDIPSHPLPPFAPSITYNRIPTHTPSTSARCLCTCSPSVVTFLLCTDIYSSSIVYLLPNELHHICPSRRITPSSPPCFHPLLALHSHSLPHRPSPSSLYLSADPC